MPSRTRCEQTMNVPPENTALRIGFVTGVCCDILSSRKESWKGGKNTPMKHTSLIAVAVLALSSLSFIPLSGAQQMPKPPQFEFDPKWPVIPNNWVLGEVTSISVDRHDNIWVLHVPQSVPEAQRANAAPPVLEFDAAGKLLTSWGGPAGSEWLGREHGIFVDANDFV